MSEKIELIEFMNLPDYQNLPYIFGNEDEFKSLYLNLIKINFPPFLSDSTTNSEEKA